jgi:hypothetical protein
VDQIELRAHFKVLSTACDGAIISRKKPKNRRGTLLAFSHVPVSGEDRAARSTIPLVRFSNYERLHASQEIPMRWFLNKLFCDLRAGGRSNWPVRLAGAVGGAAGAAIALLWRPDLGWFWPGLMGFGIMTGAGIVFGQLVGERLFRPSSGGPPDHLPNA